MRIALCHAACRLYNRYTVYITIHHYTSLYIYSIIQRIHYTSLYTPPLRQNALTQSQTQESQRRAAAPNVLTTAAARLQVLQPPSLTCQVHPRPVSCHTVHTRGYIRCMYKVYRIIRFTAFVERFEAVIPLHSIPSSELPQHAAAACLPPPVPAFTSGCLISMPQRARSVRKRICTQYASCPMSHVGDVLRNHGIERGGRGETEGERPCRLEMGRP
jgi:hypothetical protein